MPDLLSSIAAEVDEVEFSCKAKNDNEEDGSKIKDEIEFKVKTESRGLKVKVEYEQEIKTENSETESETQYEIIFNRLVEYRKANNDSASEAYAWGVDDVVQDVSLLTWGTFSDVMDDEDGTVSTFSVSTPDNVASFAFHVSRAGDGAAVTANKMKIDFRLTAFQWAQSDTYVALICDIKSKKKVEVDYEGDDEEDDDTGKKPRKAKDVRISFDDAVDGTNGFIPFGQYTWDDVATVIDANSTDTGSSENATIQVIATSPLESSTTSESIAFSFVGDAAHSAADIYWDPEAGIQYKSGAAQLALSSIGVIAGAAYVMMSLL